MAKRQFLSAFLLAFVLVLAACGGSGAPQQDAAPESDTQTEAAAPESEAVELDSDAILDIVEEACPIPLSAATDIKVGVERDGLRTVTFGSKYGDFSYTIDIHTGEIVDKVEPEVTEEQASDDPVQNAIQACFDSIDGFNGGAENIKVSISSEDGVQMVNVTFDWNGQFYDMTCNTETGEVVRN